MENGAKTLCRCQGNGETKDGAPLEAKGNWGLSCGRGQLKGSEGKATKLPK